MIVRDECFVYIIGTGSGLYKIGMANDPISRYKSLKAGIPEKSEMVMMIRCRNRPKAVALEMTLHKELEMYHAHGEWFKPPKEFIAVLVFDMGKRINDIWGNIYDCQYYDNTYNIDIDYSPRPIWLQVRTILRDMCFRESYARIEDVVKEALRVGISEEDVMSVIGKMRYDGDLWGPRPGIVKLIGEHKT